MVHRAAGVVGEFEILADEDLVFPLKHVEACERGILGKMKNSHEAAMTLTLLCEVNHRDTNRRSSCSTYDEKKKETLRLQALRRLLCFASLSNPALQSDHLFTTMGTRKGGGLELKLSLGCLQNRYHACSSLIPASHVGTRKSLTSIRSYFSLRRTYRSLIPYGFGRQHTPSPHMPSPHMPCAT